MLAFLELAIVAFGFWLLVTQLIVPLWVGLPVFPILRLRKLTANIDNAREEVVADVLTKEAERIRKTLRPEDNDVNLTQ